MYLTIHTHTFVTTTMKKIPFESEQGGLYGRIWREKMERRNDLIMLLTIKMKNLFKV